jgi:hypothetical protein
MARKPSLVRRRFIPSLLIGLTPFAFLEEGVFSPILDKITNEELPTTKGLVQFILQNVPVLFKFST